MIGSTLAQYKVTAALGAGGMGEVWKAEDTRLGREVALKVLPEEFAADPQRLERFEREAKMLASLNHPNIATLFGLETVSGTEAETGTGPTTFLAMELVEGEDLSERINRGPIPIDEAIPIALQIAEALEAAHEQGIVHRDLKPANIKLSEDGTVKVLDFGLAKAWESETGDLNSSLSPTVTPATAAGVILGTAAYMSPEQARGQHVDRRADIWSYGVVLWEMFTGKKLFAGDTVSDVLASVLKDAPDLEAVPRSTPSGIRRLLARCLDKDPKNRLQWIGDARLDLAEARDAESLEPQSSARKDRSGRFGWLPWVFAAAAAVMAGLLLIWPSPQIDTPLTRFSISVGSEQQLSFVGLPIVELSPDGRVLAFNATSLNKGQDMIFLRRLPEDNVWPLVGTEGGSCPFFSPDGKHIGFFADGKLKRIPVDGGSVVELAETPNPRGGVWLPDNTIVYSPEYAAGLFRIPSSGGTPEVLLDADPGKSERTFRLPDVHPNGRVILFTVGRVESPNSYEDAAITAYSLDSGRRTVLVDGANMARFVAQDKLVYWKSGALFVIAFDPERIETRGEPVAVIDDVGGDPSSGAGYFTVSESGSIAWVTGAVTETDALLSVVDSDGNAERLPLSPRGFHQPRFSPDGTRLAVTVGRGQYGVDGDVWLYYFETGALNRLTFEGNNVYPLWNPDGRKIAFTDYKVASLISTKSADGSGSAERLTPDDSSPLFPGSFSPDGKILAYTRVGQSSDVYLLTIGEEARLFESDASGPTFSPDGRWIAYASPASGTSRVFVRQVAGDGKWQVSPGMGAYPKWSGDGTRLFYVEIGSPERPLMVVDVERGNTFRTGSPRVLIKDLGHRFLTATAPAVNWDVSPADGRFVFVEYERDERASARVEFALNWAQNLDVETR